MAQDGEVRVVDDSAKERFEVWIGDRLGGIASYELRPGRIIFLHTKVDRALEGHGLGSRLARGALDSARADGLGVVPECPFIAAYIERHPDYADLVVAPT